MKRNEYKKVVYICSRYAGDVESNVLKTKRYCLFVIEQGYIPFAAHLLYPQFLDDDDVKQRALGLHFGNTLMDRCDEVWVFGSEYSAGMQAEFDRASEKGYVIRHFTLDCEEVKDGRV